MKTIIYRDFTIPLLSLGITILFGLGSIMIWLLAVNSLTSNDWLQTIIMGYLGMVIYSTTSVIGLFIFINSLLNPEFKELKKRGA